MRGLYLVTDRGLCGNRSLEDVAHQALLGGAACIQLREKDVSTRFFVEEATEDEGTDGQIPCASHHK